MVPRYSIYKGLQKPLIYRGFKGKFIYWGIGSLVGGLVLGGLIGALTNMYLGGLLTIVLICLGLGYTFLRQKDGLHNKKCYRGIIVHPAQLKISYGNRKKNGI
ncbi:DUF4133 domain-containing protein [Nubsella zeaxanthinifaciens]|uniref:DUF4133 domain-containing protein n=1 Tax=Nubsella zeaxanthinifaciens TaxID=392412 RepID=UPI003D051C9F